jgi:hypothetical protein
VIRSLLLIVLLPSSLLLGWQPAEPGDALRGRVDQLVRLLDSPQLARRDSAEKQLSEMGPPILSLLPDDSQLDSNEVRQRLGRVRASLEKELSVRATRASRVDLSGRMTIAEALQALAEQSGNQVTSRPAGNKAHDFDILQQPYWHALDQLLDAGQLNLALARSPRGHLATRARPDQQRGRFGQADYAGVFRIEAVQISSTRDLQNPALKVTQLSLEISWEPRLQPIYLAIPLKSVRGLTENNKPVGADDPEGIRTANMEGNVTAVRIQLPLASIPRQETSIAQFKAALQTVIPGHQGEFLFGQLTETQQRRRQGGVQVILHQAIAKGEQCEVQFSVIYPAAARAFESHRGWIRNNPAWLMDANGTRHKPISLTTTGQAENRVDFRGRFPIQGSLADHAFIYQSPILLAEQSIEFELEGIPLP